MFDFGNIQYILFAMLFLFVVILVITLMSLRHEQQRLRDRNRLLDALIESIPSPVFYKNRGGVYLGCNKAFTVMLGRGREQIVGRTVYDMAPEELAAVYKKADDALFAQGGEQRYETQVQYADGSIHEMFFTKSVFNGGRGNAAGLLGVMLDITDRKQAERHLLDAHEDLECKVVERTAELVHSNQQLENEIRIREIAEKNIRLQKDFLDIIINSIDHGLVVVDVKTSEVVLANYAASGGKSAVGMKCYELLHMRGSPCSNDTLACPMHMVKKTGKPYVTAHEHLDAHGQSVHMEIHSYPVRNEQGEVVQIIENIMDVTARRRAERAIIDARDLAESSNQLMSEFVDTVSHELRTPMTSVHGFAKLIRKSFTRDFMTLTSHDPKLQKSGKRILDNIDIILSESERLTGLISDHLDLSKLESGSVEWRHDTIDPAALVERVRQATASLFKGDAVVFHIENKNAPPAVVGDENRLLQVLINLVSNARKFTVRGTITCRVESCDEGVLFSVSDTGIGIEEEKVHSIFSKFTQIKTGAEVKPSGTGLGLAISEEIVKYHGGRMWVESTPGVGSTFFFVLPA